MIKIKETSNEQGCNDLINYNRKTLENEGFQGFVSIKELKKSCSFIPKSKGVYVVYRESKLEPRFLKKSVGGHFKGYEPTISVDELLDKWVHGANLVYIGATSSLQTRIKILIEFGSGKPIAHWGGRFIWQLADHNNLLIGWKVLHDDNPHAFKRNLIENFGILPFANLKNEYVRAYDPIICRRVPHVLKDGWAVSLVSGNKFEYES